jgi:DNA-binding response OmpR family regulator
VSRILVIEDHEPMAELISLVLRENGHEAELAGSLERAGVLLEQARYDLITLDVNLPDGKGHDFCKELRLRNDTTPIIMLTSEISAESVARGLESGADDYLKKPIDPLELKARLRGHLRRQSAAIEFEGLKIDPDRRRATYQDAEIPLTGRQFEILLVFARRPEIVLTRESLIAQLGHALDISDRTIDSHVSQLRKRLREAGITRIQLTPVYGVGYRLEQG